MLCSRKTHFREEYDKHAQQEETMTSMNRSYQPTCLTTASVALTAVLFLVGCKSWPPPKDEPPDAAIMVEITSEPSGAEIWSVAKMHRNDIDWKESIKVGTTPFKGLTAFYIHPEGRQMAVRSPGNSANLFHFRAQDGRLFVRGKKAVLSMNFTLKKKGYKKKVISEIVCENTVTKVVGFADANEIVEEMRKALIEKRVVKHNYVLSK